MQYETHRQYTTHIKDAIITIRLYLATCFGRDRPSSGKLRTTINLLAPELFFFYFSTPCIQNVNNTGTKYVRIMKQTAFLREKKTESIHYV